MAFIKFANCSVLEAQIATPRGGLMKDAHRHAFQYEPRPGYLYVRSRAISSRTNDNYDTFPAEEIKEAWATFIGKPVFVNHHNSDHKRARGVIIDAALHEDTAPDGTADTWVEVLMEVDAIRYPKLAEAIVRGDIERTSMGCDVVSSRCSVCDNVARTPDQYCPHVARMKGQRIRRKNPHTGAIEDVLAHEICSGLSFFENSLLVEAPADPTAYFLGVDTRGMQMTASTKTAASVGDQEVVIDWDDNPDVMEVWLQRPGERDLEYVGYLYPPAQDERMNPGQLVIDSGFTTKPHHGGTMPIGLWAKGKDAIEGWVASVVGSPSIVRRGVNKTAKIVGPLPCKTASVNYTMVSGGPDNAFELHVAGCSDLYRPKYVVTNKHDVAAESVSDAIDSWLDSQMREQGWSEGDIKVFPCARSGVGPSVAPLDPSACPGSGQPVANARRLRDACPVCGKFLGTSRGVYPKHKTGAKMTSSTRTAAHEYGPTSPGRDAGTRWEGIISLPNPAAHQVVALWPGDEAGMLSGVFDDEARADEWATMCAAAGAVNVQIENGGRWRKAATIRTADAQVHVWHIEDGSARMDLRLPHAEINGFVTADVGGYYWSIKPRSSGRPYMSQDTGLAPSLSEAMDAVENRARYHGWITDGDSIVRQGTRKTAGFLLSPAHGNGMDLDIVPPGTIPDVIPESGFFIVVARGTKARFYARATGRTTTKWNMQCPTFELYEVATTAKDGGVWGTLGARVPGIWLANPGAQSDIFGATASRKTASRIPMKQVKPGMRFKQFDSDPWFVLKDKEVMGTNKWGYLFYRWILEGGGSIEMADTEEVIVDDESVVGSKTAFGETTVPQQIDTLRRPECPVCGEDATWGGDGRCRVCGYLPPPEPFREPDLEVAKRTDLHDGNWFSPNLMSAPPFVPPNKDAAGPVKQDIPAG